MDNVKTQRYIYGHHTYVCMWTQAHTHPEIRVDKLTKGNFSSIFKGETTKRFNPNFIQTLRNYLL